MTYCVAMKVREGLVAVSDGRITAGTQVTVARKNALIGPESNRFLVMTSGLRSLRDKTLAYLRRRMREEHANGYSGLLDAVDDYCGCLRQVREEDGDQLTDADLTFNLHAIIGGQLRGDPEPTVFLVYPEGNWIEVDERTPYLSVGATTYGKPVLDRTLTYETDMKTALKLAYLSFDSTRISAADVGFPLDMMTYLASDRTWREAQYDYDDVMQQRQWWNDNITKLVKEMPDGPWVSALAGGQHVSVVSDD